MHKNWPLVFSEVVKFNEDCGVTLLGWVTKVTGNDNQSEIVDKVIIQRVDEGYVPSAIVNGEEICGPKKKELQNSN